MIVVNLLAPQSETFYDRIDFRGLQKHHEQLHEIRKEEARFQLHLLIYVHQHEFQLRFCLRGQEIRQS